MPCYKEALKKKKVDTAYLDSSVKRFNLLLMKKGFYEMRIKLTKRGKRWVDFILLVVAVMAASALMGYLIHIALM